MGLRGARTSAWVTALSLCVVALNAAAQGVRLDLHGVSTLGWAFSQAAGWRAGTHPGHDGDDAYALDWNRGAENQDQGEPVLSVASGTVIFARRGLGRVSPGRPLSYGNTVIVQLDRDPRFAVRYAHLEEVYVRVGRHVNLGDPIGTLGASGLTGVLPYTAHLHLVLYRRIDERPDPTEGCYGGREEQAALFWLARGLSLCRLEGETTKFAAPYRLDPDLRAAQPKRGPPTLAWLIAVVSVAVIALALYLRLAGAIP